MSMTISVPAVECVVISKEDDIKVNDNGSQLPEVKAIRLKMEDGKIITLILTHCIQGTVTLTLPDVT